MYRGGTLRKKDLGREVCESLWELEGGRMCTEHEHVYRKSCESLLSHILIKKYT